LTQHVFGFGLSSLVDISFWDFSLFEGLLDRVLFDLVVFGCVRDLWGFGFLDSRVRESFGLFGNQSLIGGSFDFKFDELEEIGLFRMAKACGLYWIERLVDFEFSEIYGAGVFRKTLRNAESLVRGRARRVLDLMKL
jgi:hypothetical protein